MPNHWFAFERRFALFGELCEAFFHEVVPAARVMRIELPGRFGSQYSIWVELQHPVQGDCQSLVSVDIETDILWWEGQKFKVVVDSEEHFRLQPFAILV